jgi:PAS domain S-box-containing protein
LRIPHHALRRLFEQNPLPTWFHDLHDLHFLDVNNAAIDHYGYTREEFLEMRATDLYAPADGRRLLAALQEARSESAGSGLWRHRLKNGQEVHVHVVSRMVTFGDASAALVIVRDLVALGGERQALLAMARIMEYGDARSTEHGERTMGLAGSIAKKLGCSPREIEDIRWGARLHDIGKIGVPDAIFHMSSPLTMIGEEILGAVDRLRGAATVIRHHQERWDGTGYPDGLAEGAIPFGARILAVAVAYWAMVEDQPRSPARRHEDAVAEIRRGAGSQFDPKVVDAFLALAESSWRTI